MYQEMYAEQDKQTQLIKIKEKDEEKDEEKHGKNTKR
jgi:hypothetical protein